MVTKVSFWVNHPFKFLSLSQTNIYILFYFSFMSLILVQTAEGIQEHSVWTANDLIMALSKIIIISTKIK